MLQQIKTPDSTLPCTALARVLDGFHTYKLQLQEDAVTFIRDIEKILSCVAISEDVDRDGMRQLNSLMHP